MVRHVQLGLGFPSGPRREDRKASAGGMI
jgi:hypothetical protein